MKKTMFTLILVCLLTFSLGACTQQPSGQAGADAGKYGGYTSTLYKVLNSKKITVGVIGGFVPMSWQDESGKWQGFEVEVAQLIADSLGAELELLEVTSDTRISSIETGKCDLVMGNSTPTLARNQKVAFSDTLIVSSERLLVKEDSGITGLNDLPSGAKVGTAKGATCDQVILAKRSDVEIVYYTNPSDGVIAVANGQVIAFAEDSNTLEYQCSLTTGLKVVGDPLDTISYNAMMLPIEDQVWINYINQFVRQFGVSGNNAKIFAKWVGNEPFTFLNPQY